MKVLDWNLAADWSRPVGGVYMAFTVPIVLISLLLLLVGIIKTICNHCIETMFHVALLVVIKNGFAKYLSNILHSSTTYIRDRTFILKWRQKEE